MEGRNTELLLIKLSVKLLERLTCAREAATDSRERDLQDIRDLTIGETLSIQKQASGRALGQAGQHILNHLTLPNLFLEVLRAFHGVFAWLIEALFPSSLWRRERHQGDMLATSPFAAHL